MDQLSQIVKAVQGQILVCYCNRISLALGLCWFDLVTFKTSLRTVLEYIDVAGMFDELIS